ncbi:hypothetical protein TNIN_447811 [Trichonephila inaurata madagascariensis]|uniref:Ig-like domain-containing protein n=1 Tax=Trichonephila inaurata madagascariensis TaxID=2747483 RepID=A0A8X6IJF5_9ARAC|nr:hypothetical protein TNIN_447811 [Trichonephila inaurata madagascariensis]
MAIVITVLYFLISMLGLTVQPENSDVNDFIPISINRVTPYPQVGQPLQIDCQVTGHFPSGLQVTWHKDGQMLSNSSRMEIMSNHTLLIFSAQNEDSGTYTCSAKYKKSQSSISIYIKINSDDFKLNLERITCKQRKCEEFCKSIRPIPKRGHCDRNTCRCY